MRRQRIVKRILVDETAARRIHEYRPVAQQAQFAAGHQRRAAAGHVQREDVALRQQRVEIRAIARAGLDLGRRRPPVGIDDLHPEAARTLRDRPADPAETDDPERLAVHARAEHVGHAERLSPPGAHDTLVLRRTPARSQYQQHREIGRAISQRVGCVADRDAACACGGDIHVVVPGARIRDDLHARRQCRDVLGLQPRFLADQHRRCLVAVAELDDGRRVHVGVRDIRVEFGFGACGHRGGNASRNQQAGAIVVRHGLVLESENGTQPTNGSRRRSILIDPINMSSRHATTGGPNDSGHALCHARYRAGARTAQPRTQENPDAGPSGRGG